MPYFLFCCVEKECILLSFFSILCWKELLFKFYVLFNCLSLSLVLYICACLITKLQNCWLIEIIQCFSTSPPPPPSPLCIRRLTNKQNREVFRCMFGVYVCIFLYVCTVSKLMLLRKKCVCLCRLPDWGGGDGVLCSVHLSVSRQGFQTIALSIWYLLLRFPPPSRGGGGRKGGPPSPMLEMHFGIEITLTHVC